jgi:hypothetical protein
MPSNKIPKIRSRVLLSTFPVCTSSSIFLFSNQIYKSNAKKILDS